MHLKSSRNLLSTVSFVYMNSYENYLESRNPLQPVAQVQMTLMAFHLGHARSEPAHDQRLSFRLHRGLKAWALVDSMTTSCPDTTTSEIMDTRRT